MGVFSPALETLAAFYAHELRRLFHVEVEQESLFAEWRGYGTSHRLHECLAMQEENNLRQKLRLERILGRMDGKIPEVSCEVMASLGGEIRNACKMAHSGAVRDMVLVLTLRKVKHYEMAAYSNLVAVAKQLNFQENVLILETSLEEELKSDEALHRLASNSLNARADREDPDITIF